jgi:hypothetical protein
MNLVPNNKKKTQCKKVNHHIVQLAIIFLLVIHVINLGTYSLTTFGK